MPPLGSISGVFIYPVKSLPGILLEKALVTKNGIAHSDNANIVDRFILFNSNINS